jgi:hypothetical protein
MKLNALRIERLLAKVEAESRASPRRAAASADFSSDA